MWPHSVQFNDHIFETPIHDCPMDKLDEFWAIGKCSGNGMRAERQNEPINHRDKVNLKLTLTLQTPQATVHSSEDAEAWFAWHSMQRSMMWFRQMAQLSTTMSQAQRATALHYNKHKGRISIQLITHISTIAYLR